MRKLMPILGLLLLPASICAQKFPPRQGMVMDEGEWRTPTATLALRDLRSSDVPKENARAAAVAVLRQTYGSHTQAVLAAFVDDLVELMRSEDRLLSHAAAMVLYSAGDTEDTGGIPYSGVAEVFIEVYESYEDRHSRKAKQALFDAFHTGGQEYVRALFEASERPPRCWQGPQGHIRDPDPPDPSNPCPPASTWCDAGLLLLDTAHGPDRAQYNARCVKRRI